MLIIKKKRTVWETDFYILGALSFNQAGVYNKMISTLTLAVHYTPSTIEWNSSVAIIMIFSNLFVIAISRYAIKNPGQGPNFPIPLPGVFTNFGIPELLATTSLGHIIGAGIILGLGNAGVL